jgi:hypothetical protein
MIATSKLALMIATLTAAFISAPAPADAQGGSSAASPTPVPINSGTFAKFMKASSNFASYMKEHPADADLGDASYDNETDAATQICGPRPGVQKAIAAGGLTCLQWVTLTAELEKAQSAAAMVKAGQKVPSEFGVSAGDIDFYNKHTAEVKLALQEISASNETQ